MSNLKAVIFDLEGVVIDTEPIWDEVAEIFLKRRGFPYDRETLKPQTMGRSMSEGIRIWQTHYGFGGDLQELSQERRTIAKELLSVSLKFIPGFLEFHESIRGKYKTAIATSLERLFLEPAIKSMSLDDLFEDHIYSIEDIGFIAKPNPDIYLFAARKIESSPLLSAGIEDSPNGIEALRRAKMKSVGITTSTTREKLASANLVVDSFSEIDLNKL